MASRLCAHVVLFLFAVLASQTSAQAAKYNTNAVVKTLRSVAPHETLPKFKKHLPRTTRYKWEARQASSLDWTWNVLNFHGVRGGTEYSGVAIFANDRAKFARLRPASNEEQRKQILKDATKWRVADKLHSVHMFLGKEREVYEVAVIDRETMRQMDALSRLLGKPHKREHNRYGDGPEDAGWSATWKLSRGRELYFAETLALLDSAVRPSLELSFSYSQMYRS